MAGLTKREPPCSGSRWLALRWLWRIFDDDADCNPAPGQDATPADDDSYLGKLCVLVVDDDPVNLMIASEMLSAWGITPLLAADGAEAVTLARDLPMDLILMDLQMPVLDGLAAAKQIRCVEHEFAKVRVPIVAYTSAPPAEISLRHFGIDGVLAKPCDRLALHACLMRWCPPNAGATAPAPADAMMLVDRFDAPFAAVFASRARDRS